MSDLEPRQWGRRSWRESFEKSYYENIATGESVHSARKDLRREMFSLSTLKLRGDPGSPLHPSPAVHLLVLTTVSTSDVSLTLATTAIFPALTYCKLGIVFLNVTVCASIPATQNCPHTARGRFSLSVYASLKPS